MGDKKGTQVKGKILTCFESTRPYDINVSMLWNTVYCYSLLPNIDIFWSNWSQFHVKKVNGRALHARPRCAFVRGKANFLKVWGLNFLVIRVCYVSRSDSLKSWILTKSHDSILRTAINCTHFTRAGITGILQGIEFCVVKYWHWVRFEDMLPMHLGILRALICLVSFYRQYF